MTDVVNNEITEQNTDETPESIREHAAFKAVVNQVNAERARNKEIEAKLNKLLEDQDVRKKQEEQAALEAKGDYEAALNKLRAEAEAREAQYKRDILTRDLTTELLKAGCTDELVITGAIAKYDDNTIPFADFVKELKEKSPSLFAGNRMNPASAPPQGGQSGTLSSKIDWTKVKQQLKTGGPLAAEKANQMVAEYVDANGSMPPGF